MKRSDRFIDLDGSNSRSKFRKIDEGSSVITYGGVVTSDDCVNSMQPRVVLTDILKGGKKFDKDSKHVQTDNESPKNGDNLCKINAKTQVTLDKHMNIFHPWKCGIKGCNKTFAAKSHYKNHLKNHIYISGHLCAKCNQRYKTQDALERHMQTMHTMIYHPWQCHVPACKKIFITQSHLRNHLKKHSDIYSYKCAMCNLTCQTQHALKCHIESMHTTTAYNSDSLDIASGDAPYPDKGLHQQHVKCGEITDLHACRKCPRRFNTEAGLRQHMTCSHKPEPSQVYHNINMAQQLDPIYVGDNNIQHTIQHKSSIACSGCSQTFSNEIELMTHQEFCMCTVCKKCFDHWDLPRHIEEFHNKGILPDQISNQISPTAGLDNSLESLKDKTVPSHDSQEDLKAEDILFHEEKEPCLKAGDNMAPGNSNESVENVSIEQGFVNNKHNTQASDDNMPIHSNGDRVTIISPNMLEEFVVNKVGRTEPPRGPIKSEENVNIEQDFIAMEEDTQAPDDNIWIEPDPSTVTVITPMCEDSGSDTTEIDSGSENEIDRLQNIP